MPIFGVSKKKNILFIFTGHFQKQFMLLINQSNCLQTVKLQKIDKKVIKYKKLRRYSIEERMR